MGEEEAKDIGNCKYLLKLLSSGMDDDKEEEEEQQQAEKSEVVRLEGEYLEHKVKSREGALPTAQREAEVDEVNVGVGGEVHEPGSSETKKNPENHILKKSVCRRGATRCCCWMRGCQCSAHGWQERAQLRGGVVVARLATPRTCTQDRHRQIGVG